MALSTSAAMLAILDVASASPATQIAHERAAADLPAGLGVLAVELPEAIRDKSLTAAELSINWQRAPRLGTMSVKFILIAADGKTSNHWGRIRIGERARVLVAARALKAGTTVTSGDLVSRVETVERGRGWRLATGALKGSRILRDVAADTRIGDDDIEAPPPLSRGSEISVEINKGRLRVATRGVLERAARPGEMVGIRLNATRRVVRARLVSSATAVVEKSK